MNVHVDVVILRALNNPEQRDFVLKLESDFASFVDKEGPIEDDEGLCFPPMSSFSRLLVHKIAEFFDLETESYGEEPMRYVRVRRTEQSHKYSKNVCLRTPA